MTGAPEPEARTLVVGHTGLLGAAVCRRLRAQGIEPVTRAVRWGAPDADLEAAFRSVTADGGPWRVVWCAGAGVPSSPSPVLDVEVAVFRRFCERLARSRRGRDGVLFLSSSAGGLYAGSPSAPFDEASPVQPLAPYGHAKVDAERVAAGLADAGVRVVIGRIANLYGPGQNLSKPQGLVSQLCLSILTRRPLGIYVPLDTLRDYLFVEDAAAKIIGTTNLAATLSPGAPPVIKVLASGRSVSIAQLLGEFRTVTKRRPPVVLAASPHRKVQARDLRLRSVVWPEIDRGSLVPLTAGIDACLRDVGERWRLGMRGQSPPGTR
jgi:UDP-glucose 4-epimerase